MSLDSAPAISTQSISPSPEAKPLTPKAKSGQRRPPVCRFFNSSGGCRAGAECRFRHVPPRQKKDDSGVGGPEVQVSDENGVEQPVDRNVAIPQQEAPHEGSEALSQSNSPTKSSEEKAERNRRRRPPRRRNQPSKGGDAESSPSARSTPSASPPKKPSHQPASLPVSTPLVTTPQPAAEKPAPPVRPVQKTPTTRPAVSRPAVSRPQPKSLETQLQETSDPVERAQITREMELQQLERRYTPTGYRVISSDSKASTVQIGIVPTDPDFPYELESLRLHIIVPSTYPITPSEIRVLNKEIPADFARNIEKAWGRKSLGARVSLLAMLNWLDRNLEELLAKAPESAGPITFVSNAASGQGVKGGEEVESRGREKEELVGVEVHRKERDGDRVFYYGIPVGGGGGSDETDEGSFSEEESEEEDGEGLASGDGVDGEGHGDEEGSSDDQVVSDDSTTRVANKPVSSTASNLATQIRLIDPLLEHIQILECTSLSLTLRCTKCKHTFDITNLPADHQHQKEHWYPCEKCGAELGVRFRPSFATRENPNLGALDLVNCAVFDLLPSTFNPWCGGCERKQPPNRLMKSVVRGRAIVTSCHHCGKRLTLRIEDVKFVRAQAEALTSSSSALPKRKRKPKDEITLSHDTPLPQNGTCPHYKRSYRYFRFPCCGKLYPCDICHEQQKKDTHEMQWATRMVCGFCSREQVYSAEKTCVCGREVTRGGGRGYWEGGKGTRDRVRMSRKEERKFKGLSKTVSMKAARVGKKH
ncbi:hypothetical protein HDV00_006804 [Rhizophlyctis rosea]|nr:hypothetical protein HDV00_006804 [Rhizophlyctis rosea]